MTRHPTARAHQRITELVRTLVAAALGIEQPLIGRSADLCRATVRTYVRDGPSRFDGAALQHELLIEHHGDHRCTRVAWLPCGFVDRLNRLRRLPEQILVIVAGLVRIEFSAQHERGHAAGYQEAGQ
jgi:hypothetical protein